MLAVFPPIFVVDTKITLVYNFVAPLSLCGLHPFARKGQFTNHVVTILQLVKPSSSFQNFYYSITSIQKINCLTTVKFVTRMLIQHIRK